MGNSAVAVPSLDGNLLKNNYKVTKVEYLSHWKLTDRFFLSSITISGSYVKSGFYYHDLFKNGRSFITGCNIKRSNGKQYSWRDSWSGAVESNDTILWTDSVAKEKKVYIKDEVERGKYINDESKLRSITDSFKTKEKLLELKVLIRVTQGKWERYLDDDSKWGQYEVLVPQDVILQGLKLAKKSTKPKIVEEVEKKKEEKPIAKKRVTKPTTKVTKQIDAPPQPKKNEIMSTSKTNYKTLLNEWGLSKYVKTFEENDCTDVTDWKQFTINELKNDLKMSFGHAKRFTRVRDAYFSNVQM